MSEKFALKVNGQTHQVEVEPDTALLYVLRNDLGLYGAKYGCGVEQCGACNVIIDNEAVNSCSITVAELYAGLSEEERSGANRLIDAMDYHDVSREIAKEAGRYRYEFARRGTSLSTTDTLLAATAIAEGAILITANTKDFPMEEIELLEHP